MADEEFFLLADREVVITPHMHLHCDGGNSTLGHPRIFITLAKDGEVTCTYCGRRYVHVSCPAAAEIRKTGKPVIA
jgi:uncharacterized Zn-finger protein